MKLRNLLSIAALTVAAANTSVTLAQDADLARKLSNPVADLISVPFQFNADYGIGSDDDGAKYLLNIQPVIPFSLSEDYNLITRTIMPLVYQDDVVNDGGSTQFGTGDVLQSFFLSPKEPVGGAIVGVGPVVLWPTGSNDSLGSEKWGLGPTGVILWQKGPWTYGLLANHVWSVAGDDDRSYVNATFLQPFISYTTSTATSFTINTESTYDWNGEQWTVPINVMVGQVVKLGQQPAQIALGARYYAEGPDEGAEWGFRCMFTLLFPK
jgi:hypothetical protein